MEVKGVHLKKREKTARKKERESGMREGQRERKERGTDRV